MADLLIQLYVSQVCATVMYPPKDDLEQFNIETIRKVTHHSSGKVFIPMIEFKMNDSCVIK